MPVPLGLTRDAYFDEESKVTDEIYDFAADMVDFAGEAIEVHTPHRFQAQTYPQTDTPDNSRLFQIDELAARFGGVDRVAVMSDHHCRLQELTSCWQKNPDGTVGEQASRRKNLLRYFPAFA